MKRHEQQMKITLFSLTILFSLLLTSCSRKLYVDHYSSACDVDGKEYGKLFLFSNGKFLLTSKNCGRILQFEAQSYGTYFKESDSLIILNSGDYKLDPISVSENKSNDSTYKILIVSKRGEGFINETMKIVINQKDTLSWLQKPRIPFNPNNPSISSIQFILYNLNYTSPIYYIKNKENNIIKFELKAEWYAMSTFPSYLLLDHFKFSKSGDTITGSTNMLTRSSILTLNYVGRTKKTPRKITKLYFGGNKRMLDYFDMDNDKVTTSN